MLNQSVNISLQLVDLAARHADQLLPFTWGNQWCRLDVMSKLLWLTGERIVRNEFPKDPRFFVQTVANSELGDGVEDRALTCLACFAVFPTRLRSLVTSHQIVNEMKLVMTNNLKLEYLGGINEHPLGTTSGLVGLTVKLLGLRHKCLSTPKVTTLTSGNNNLCRPNNKLFECWCLWLKSRCTLQSFWFEAFRVKLSTPFVWNLFFNLKCHNVETLSEYIPITLPYATCDDAGGSDMCETRHVSVVSFPLASEVFGAGHSVGHSVLVAGALVWRIHTDGWWTNWRSSYVGASSWSGVAREKQKNERKCDDRMKWRWDLKLRLYVFFQSGHVLLVRVRVIVYEYNISYQARSRPKKLRLPTCLGPHINGFFRFL